MSGNLKIGDLGKRTDCPVETIRYYEQEGLLPAPARSQSNYRLYGDAHVERLQFIRHCRSLDMTLDEIRSLLRFRDAPEDNCEEVNLLLDQHIWHVARRIAELQALQDQLQTLRSQCHMAQSAKDCGILQSLASTENAPVNLGTHS
ncbi:MAG: cadR, partial [Burkholderia sp.]|nr:cadR [Burkholderia sp.]